MNSKSKALDNAYAEGFKESHKMLYKALQKQATSNEEYSILESLIKLMEG